MSEDLLESLKQDVETAEKQLVDLDKMIQVAQKAGEDVTSLKAKYQNVKTKVDRWKKALG